MQCSNLDGTRVCDVATGLSEPWGIALGPTHIFWTERRRGAIMSCSLRTGQVHELLSGLNAPEGIGVLNGPVHPGIDFKDALPVPPLEAAPPRTVPRPRRSGQRTAADQKVFVFHGGSPPPRSTATLRAMPRARAAVAAPLPEIDFHTTQQWLEQTRHRPPRAVDMIGFADQTLSRIYNNGTV